MKNLECSEFCSLDRSDCKTAFIKGYCAEDGIFRWYIFSEDGKTIGATENRENAFLVAKQYNLTPVSVH